MLASHTQLRCWKSEHTEQTCQDFCSSEIAKGLFAISDGVGTAALSDLWAKVLVQHFLSVPLLSNHPFEIEWWLEQAQQLFRQQQPDLEWGARQQIESQGSYATLATLRFEYVQDETAKALLLIFGDSCIFIARTQSHQIKEVNAFPPFEATDFDRAPICLPSKSDVFNRACQSYPVELQTGDTVVLATDAVSRWIISAPDRVVALQTIIDQTPTSWSDFINEHRINGEMIDDDCTALIIRLAPHIASSDKPRNTTYEHSEEEYWKLGFTSGHPKEERQKRLKVFNDVYYKRDSERIAIIYGDGTDLQQEGIIVLPDEIDYARSVANALREMVSLLRREIGKPNRLTSLGEAWQSRAHLLREERCAADLSAHPL